MAGIIGSITAHARPLRGITPTRLNTTIMMAGTAPDGIARRYIQMIEVVKGNKAEREAEHGLEDHQRNLTDDDPGAGSVR